MFIIIQSFNHSIIRFANIMSDEVTCISFTGQVTKKPHMLIKSNIGGTPHYYMVDTKHREIGDFIDAKLNDVSSNWCYKIQKDFKTVKLNKIKGTKKTADLRQAYYSPLPGHVYRIEKGKYEDFQVVYICKAHRCILAKWWRINNTVIIMKKETGSTYRWTDIPSHPLIPRYEYIGMFKTKSEIKIPAQRIVEYTCSVCRHAESGMKLKEVKGIEHSCCICMENKASILCTKCSAIHACMECVNKQCKLIPLY